MFILTSSLIINCFFKHRIWFFTLKYRKCVFDESVMKVSKFRYLHVCISVDRFLLVRYLWLQSESSFAIFTLNDTLVLIFRTVVLRLVVCWCFILFHWTWSDGILFLILNNANILICVQCTRGRWLRQHGCSIVWSTRHFPSLVANSWLLSWFLIQSWFVSV